MLFVRSYDRCIRGVRTGWEGAHREHTDRQRTHIHAKNTENRYMTRREHTEAQRTHRGAVNTKIHREHTENTQTRKEHT